MNQDDDIRRGHAMVEEPELLALFARHRPDGDAFVRGVQQRLAGRERGDGHGEAPLLRAAGRLPIDLGALGAAKWSLLAPPTLFLTLIGSVFLASFRWLRCTLAKGPVRTAPTPLGHGASTGQVSELVMATCVLAGLLLFAGTAWLPDVLLLSILAAMLYLAVAVRYAAGSHGLDRAVVGTLGIGVLQSVLLFGLFWLLADGPLAGGAQWQSATLVVLVGGILLLLPAAPKASLGVVIMLAILGWFGMRDLGVRRPDLDTLAEFVATAPVPEDPFIETGDLARFVVALRDRGRLVPLPSAVEQALVAARDADPVASFPLTAEHRMGRIDRNEWRRLAVRRDRAAMLDRLLRGTHPLRPFPTSEHEIAMLVAARDLDEPTRDHLAARLLAGLDGATFPLEATAVAARWLDQLGRGALLAARRSAIHDLLVRHQHLGTHDPGGFCPQLDIPHSSRQTTQDAIELMERFGVPAALDLPLLHQHLRRASRLFASQSVAESRFQLNAYVDQLRLERLVGVPRRSLLRTLVDERTFVAMAALVLVCLYAAWAAPRRDVLPAGAMP